MPERNDKRKSPTAPYASTASDFEKVLVERLKREEMLRAMAKRPLWSDAEVSPGLVANRNYYDKQRGKR